MVGGAGGSQQDDRLDDRPSEGAVGRVVAELHAHGRVVRVGPRDALGAQDDAQRAAFEADPALGVQVVDLRHAAARHQFAGGFAHHLQTGDQREQGQAFERGGGVGELRGAEGVITQEGVVLQRQNLDDFHHDAGLFFEDRGVGEHREIGAEIKASLVRNHRHGFARLFGGGARRGEEFTGRSE